jgi:hypothetical protein
MKILKLDSPFIDKSLRAQIVDTVRDEGYIIIRGLVSGEKTLNVIERLEKFRITCNAEGASSKIDGISSQIKSKIVIGGGSQQEYYVPRALQVIYNALESPDEFEAHSVFDRSIRFRNKLQNLVDTYCSREFPQANESFTALRFQFYPSGGGFFHRHRDVILERAQSSVFDAEFFQMVILMNGRGFGYEAGGAFVLNSRGDVIDIESNGIPGDLVIYDGRSEHGVADIDPHLALNFTSNRGKWSALISLYARR